LITTLSSSKISIKINHLGAELVSLQNAENKEHIWNGDPKYWSKHSPVLFPIVGSLKNDHYALHGVNYQLFRHGFARDMEFKLVEESENSALFSIQNNEETLKVYPFLFEFQIQYIIKDTRVEVHFKVINTSDSAMPFSLGAHPAFALANNFETYQLQFENEKEKLAYFPLENNLISAHPNTLNIENNLLPLNYALFEQDALIFKQLNSNAVTLLERNTPFLRVAFNDFPSLGIWTKKDAPFICIEPWIGYADTTTNSGNLFEKEGVRILEAHSYFDCQYSIELL
jgi:galactose mutarotase-like enzyme